MGLGLGALVAFLIEQTDNTIKNISDIERRGISVLGIIPDITKTKNTQKVKINRKNQEKTNEEQKVLLM